MGLSAKQPISECGEGVAKEESTSASLLQTMISRARPLWHQDGNPASYKIATTLVVRLLGVVYLIAFISLWVQIDGLIGSHGIVPAGEYLSAVEQICASEHPPESAFWRVPTLAWISSSDFFLNALCVAGAVFSSVLIPKKLVILGPSHRSIQSRFAIMREGSWETPLGDIFIDTPLAELIMNRTNLVTEDENAHLNEHSLEVQLPFIQYFIKV